MNRNIILIEILKDAPKGTKLYSPLCGECTFSGIDDESEFAIIVKSCANNELLTFTSDGRYSKNSECLLFPSEENWDWSTFKAPWRHKHFKPFEKVLISHFTDDFPGKEIWIPALYGYYDEEIKNHILINGSSRDDDSIIPYESNEDKLGKPVK